MLIYLVKEGSKCFIVNLFILKMHLVKHNSLGLFISIVNQTDAKDTHNYYDILVNILSFAIIPSPGLIKVNVGWTLI